MSCRDLAQKAFSGIESARGRPRRPEHHQPYVELLAPDSVLEISAPARTPLGDPVAGQAAIADFWTRVAPKLFEDIVLEEPLDYIADDDHAVVIGRETYRIALTGRQVKHKTFTAILDFRDGLIVRDRRVLEMTEFVDAHRAAAEEAR